MLALAEQGKWVAVVHAVVNMCVCVCVCVCVRACRSIVSASQDGKLIVWDGYTTNKVGLDHIC